MRKEEVEAAYKRGEGQDAEFKASVSLKREIGETVSAFSNSNDGIILIGVQDSKDIIKAVQQLPANQIEYTHN